MPRNLPIGLGSLVKEDSAHGERLVTQDRIDDLADLAGICKLTYREKNIEKVADSKDSASPSNRFTLAKSFEGRFEVGNLARIENFWNDREAVL